MNIKPISEVFPNQKVLCEFVENGRITFNKKGYMSFFKTDFITKEDVEVISCDYGFSYEKDMQLKKENYPTTLMIPKGTKVSLHYDEYSEKIYWSIKHKYKNRDYKSNKIFVISSQEEWEKIKNKNIELFYPENPSYNSINSFYIVIINNQSKIYS
jgi:hypothetical protein